MGKAEDMEVDKEADKVEDKPEGKAEGKAGGKAEGTVYTWDISVFGIYHKESKAEGKVEDKAEDKVAGTVVRRDLRKNSLDWEASIEKILFGKQVDIFRICRVSAGTVEGKAADKAGKVEDMAEEGITAYTVCKVSASKVSSRLSVNRPNLRSIKERKRICAISKRKKAKEASPITNMPL